MNHEKPAKLPLCGNCGQEFNDSDNLGFCLPCHLAILAMEPPEELKDLRHVYGGRKTHTTGQAAWAAFMKDDPKGFLAEKRAAERDYRLAVAARMPKDAKVDVDVEEEDEGYNRVLELLAEEWEKVKELVARERGIDSIIDMPQTRNLVGP